MSKHSKIMIVIGTKAELIKCLPVMWELQKKNLDYWFVHTGQHPVRESCRKFNVKEPDYLLSKEPKISTKFWSKVNKMSMLWSLSMVFKVRRLVRKLRPKYVIYHGDTMSTAAAAIGSSPLLNPMKSWNNVHLEAGLRSGSLFDPFPEEISRQICDRFSDTLFAVSSKAVENLKNKNSKKRIINTGNTIVDSALEIYGLAQKDFSIKKPQGDYVLINSHRHENIKSKKRMEKIIEILESTTIKGIWPLHDNTEYWLKKHGLLERARNIKNIEIVPLTDYHTFMFLLANSKYLIMDGGSIQEESLIFKKPCIIMRDRTERQEGLSSGINFLTGVDVKKAQKIIKKIESGEFKIPAYENPYGKRGLSKKIVEVLEK
ncbi:hypothetical protein HN604_02875 [archaeon]|jgi:UDP-N-acetylglucosamine 2-epimerase|nr:hypothetical protein [archaeon]MBT6182800.1 hypothetical protein [archaeon]MBT6606110.1 hypothetical protein [archaeon]MBT7252050.1 hypothetical protein [archaeon]MBT7661001.1 hypothetical protein [archaeon]